MSNLIRKPILSLYKAYYTRNNSIIIKDPIGISILSLPNETGRNGVLYIDKGTWLAVDQKLPIRKFIKWEITKEYVHFYEAIKEVDFKEH